MTDVQPDMSASLDRAMTTIKGLAAAIGPLRMHPGQAVESLDEALRDPVRRWQAFVLISLLDPVVTIQLLPTLVALAASDRDALSSRQAIGRLPFHEAQARVPPIVDFLLDEADEVDYRRYAELLVHLGLSEPLRDLCVRAAKSHDPGIREVAEDFCDGFR